MPIHLDAIIIGSGQAGPSLAVRLANAGMQVALIERRRLGGTCVNDGCMPTKTMVASARAAHVARHAAQWGVNIGGPVSVDMRAVKARMDAVVTQSVANLTAWLEGTKGVRVIHGHARFSSAHTVEVNGEVLEAPKIFVNTGGRATLPPWPGIERVPVLTNSSIMALDTLPEHLVIAGASYIGLEFAQAYRRFGSRVTVIDVTERAVAREDEDVSRAVQSILEGEGVRFVLSAKDARVERLDNGRVRVRLGSSNGGAAAVEGSHLLAAVGRRPNTDDLGLDRAGIAIDARGFITVDNELRTNVDEVWALGDVNARGAFTHTSYNDYEIVAANLLDGDSRQVLAPTLASLAAPQGGSPALGAARRRVGDRIPVYALFTDPPLARIGMNVAQARASGRAALIGTMPMSRVGRARERGETQGFMQVIVDAQSERILGATLLCIEADEVIHTLLAVMAADASYRVIQRGMPIHPTVSELLPTLLSDLRPLA